MTTVNLKRLGIGVAVVSAAALAYLIPHWMTSDVERLRRTLKQMEQAAESRNARKLIGFVSPNFKSQIADSRETLQGYVFYFTQRFKGIDVQFGDLSIVVEPSGKRARASGWLVIWAADVKTGRERVISRWKKTDKVTLTFEKDGWSWLVVGFEVQKIAAPQRDDDS